MCILLEPFKITVSCVQNLQGNNLWARFIKNATRIRVLELSWYQGLCEHLQALGEHQTGHQPVFRNLRDLSCFNLRLEVAEHLPLFLNPNLVHFRLGRHPPVPAEVTILTLDYLVKTCPRLQTLHCHASSETQTDRIVTKFPDLVEFGTEGAVSPSVFRHFTKLPRLERLNLTGFTHPVHGIPEPSDDPTFAQLFSLQLSIANETDGSRLVRLIRSKGFQRLRIAFPGISNTENIGEFLNTLHTNHPNITYFAIASLAMSPHDVHIIGPPVSIRVFTSFRFLTSLIIAHHGISFKEDDIEPLGKGCPQLSHIDMASGWLYTPLPYAVLPVSAFEKFAMHIPHLVELCIDLDTSTVHEAPEPTTRQATALLDMRLHHNAIDEADALPLAMYISDIYPEADVTSPPYLAMGVVASPVDKLWLSVQEGVVLFTQARQRELERFGSQSATYPAE